MGSLYDSRAEKNLDRIGKSTRNFDTIMTMSAGPVNQIRAIKYSRELSISRPKKRRQSWKEFITARDKKVKFYMGIQTACFVSP